MRSTGIGMSSNSDGNDDRQHAVQAVACDDQRDAGGRRHRRIGQAAHVLLVHRHRQVFAGNGQPALAGFVGAGDFLAGDQAVHEHGRQAVHGGDEDDAQPRHLAAGDEQQVCSGERLSTTKLSWKPLGVSADEVTSTLSSASISGFGAGMGTPGPTNSVRWMPLSTAASVAGRQGQAQRVAGMFKIARHLGAIAVGDAPVLDRVAEIGRGQPVEAVTALNLDFADR
jgi:hypothetical protein